MSANRGGAVGDGKATIGLDGDGDGEHGSGCGGGGGDGDGGGGEFDGVGVGGDGGGVGGDCGGGKGACWGTGTWMACKVFVSSSAELASAAQTAARRKINLSLHAG